MTKKYSTVLVTGAGSGIEKATRSYLAERGFQVIATDINEEALQVFEDSNRILIIKLDVTRKEDIKNASSIVVENNEGLYGLVNGAGVIQLEPVIEAPEEERMLQFNINLFGMSHVTKAFYPLIKESQGRIVNISSAAGRFGSPFYGFYSMSKLAIQTSIRFWYNFYREKYNRSQIILT